MGASPALDAAVGFHGAHQAGIVTPAQDRMHFVSLDVVTKDRAKLVDMLQTWTRAAERMTIGAEAAPGGVAGGGPYGVPQDTGEAYELRASGLTLTIGFGPALFDDRFGLGPKKPAALTELPAFRGDRLEPARSGGDICVQACANDPQVAVHAVRNLVRLGFGVVSVRWSQLGFGRTSSTTTAQTTPRNMFGFKDGTRNIKAEEGDALDEHVWVQATDGPGAASWMAGSTSSPAGSGCTSRCGTGRPSRSRSRSSAGPRRPARRSASRREELDEPDLTKPGTDGDPAIPAEAHIALASSKNLGGVRILRRGYNFTDGSDGVGHLDAGLFFVAFVRDPGKQFVPMQRALAAKDLMNEYISHNGSALFACPPGVQPGGSWGEALFA